MVIILEKDKEMESFIDLRDQNGITQCVIEKNKFFDYLQKIKPSLLKMVHLLKNEE